MQLAFRSLRPPRRLRRAAGRRLDGVWKVRRAGGLLPPLLGVRKVIEGNRGKTTIGRFPCLPFDVRGRELRYRPPLSAFVDVVTSCDGDVCAGKATVLGRTFGSFTMRRISRDPSAG